VSQYLRQELHGLLESVDKSDIPEMYEYLKEIGGYFKRFKGGVLSSWITQPLGDGEEMDLHARATLTFFEVRIFSHTDRFPSKMSQIVIIVTTIDRQKSRSGGC
jgi:hypothetical protein